MSEGTQSKGSGGRGPKPTVVPLPQAREVSEKHLETLRASGLNDETIRLAELYTEANHRALAAIVQRKVWPRQCNAALVFPFYLPDGALAGYRVRPTNPRTEKHGKRVRVVKYDQSEQLGVLVYFTPRARAARLYADAALVCFWTEGEKKALVLDELGLCCVGLTGVWNWGDVAHRRATGEDRLHPNIRDHVVVAARHHVIVFDADARDNDQVQLAAARLCGVLFAAGALSVRFVCPPSAEQKGIDDYYAVHRAEGVLRLLETATALEPADPKNPLLRVSRVRALRDAPVSPELRLPEGYNVEKDGTLWKVGDDKHGDQKIGRGAILLQRYLDDLYTHEGRVDLCFGRDDRWVSLCVTRMAIADSRTMISELAQFGAPITSNNASKLVDWFEDLERVNAGRIERIACVARAGWHQLEGERIFVLAEPVFAHPERTPQLALDTRGDRRRMFGALTARGSLRAHVAALRTAWEADPVCAAVICGAVAATLLEPLGAPNFAIHLTGDSSRGKTSILKISSSVFGDPNDERWVASWNTTGVAAELRAAVLTDLPQCYDEVGATDAQTIERMVYMLVNGGGRTRGTQDLQLRETQSWRTVVLSTGERELADQSTATGAQVRVIQFPVGGFGALQAAEVDALREACAANAGMLGRQWVEMLLDIDDWDGLRETLAANIRTLRESVQCDPLQGRVAAYFALLGLAESLLSQLGIGHHDGRTMARLFADQDRRERTESLADRSVQLAREWVSAEPDAFPELQYVTNGDEGPSGRSNGRVLHGFRRSATTTLFIPHQFRKFCDDQRLGSRQVLRAWAERGWLQHEPGRLDKDVRIGGAKSRFYILEITDDDTGDP